MADAFFESSVKEMISAIEKAHRANEGVLARVPFASGPDADVIRERRRRLEEIREALKKSLENGRKIVESLTD